MANILDYLCWRGDICFSYAKFNEVDNLILSRLSYLPFEDFMENTESMTIKEAYSRFSKIAKPSVLQKEDLDLFPALAKSERFSHLLISDFVNHFSAETEKQFSAIVIHLPQGLYVSFRGTDDTIVGWKEDFNMCFLDNIPSQVDSLEYLQNISKKYPDQKLIVGGHSKGGNLAVYSSAFCDDFTKNKITHVYNNDGPGFSEKIIQTPEYQLVLDKLTSFVPQSSVIGRLLNHKGKSVVVKSSQSGIWQHDLFTWQVYGTKFEKLDALTVKSLFIDKTISEWLENVSPEEREKFIDIIFQILSDTKVTSIEGLSKNWFYHACVILKSYTNIDRESKDIVFHTLYSLFSLASSNFISSPNKSKILGHG